MKNAMKIWLIVLLISATALLNVDLKVFTSIVNPVSDAAAENDRAEETDLVNSDFSSLTAQSEITAEPAKPAPSPRIGAGGDAISEPSPDCNYSNEHVTVRQSIETERIMVIHEEGNYYNPYGDGQDGKRVAVYSPESTGFFVLTQRGDAERDMTIQRVLYWNTQDVLRAVAARKALPQPKEVFRAEFRDDYAAIHKITWLSERKLAFIAGASDGHGQVFRVDVLTGEVQQVTHALGDVVSYAIGQKSVVYYARRPVQIPTVLEARSRNLFGLVGYGRREVLPLSLYLETSSSDVPREISLPSGASVEFNNIWLSPDERTAIALAIESAPPSEWSRYETGATWESYGPAHVSEPVWDRRLRYRWIDLTALNSRWLNDAPAGTLAFNDTPRKVFWSKRGDYVIVSNTYVPLDLPFPEKFKGPAIAQIELGTGKTTPIMWERLRIIRDGAAVEETGPPIVDISWNADSESLDVRTAAEPSADGTTKRYVRSGGTWRGVPIPARRTSHVVQVERLERFDSPPKLVLTRPSSKYDLLYDPVPEFAQIRLGAVKLLEWDDGIGNHLRGSVTLPVGYIAGKAYPLIIQTHGFVENEFLLDGPNGTTTAFAAQAFAGCGFAVLQAPDVREAITYDAREAKAVAAGWREGVRLLIRQGLADPERIGLIGFSRTGFHALEALADDPTLYRAALISDSVQYNYLQFMMTFPGASALKSFQNVSGEFPKGVPDHAWFERSPLYRISSRVPVRLESADSPLSMWETYAFLRWQGSPVDLTYYPSGSHNLMKPSERMSSQGGAVDWFRFWLKDEVDPEPTKLERYRRWKHGVSAGAAHPMSTLSGR